MAKEVLLLGKGGEDLGLALTVDGDFVALVDINYPAKDLAYLGAKHTAISIAHALLAALGEPPVETKPDRAPLKGWARYVRLGDNHEPRYEDGSLDDLIRAFTAGYDDESRIYELVAYVGPKPQPAERKVVRL